MNQKKWQNCDTVSLFSNNPIMAGKKKRKKSWNGYRKVVEFFCKLIDSSSSVKFGRQTRRADGLVPTKYPSNRRVREMIPSGLSVMHSKTSRWSSFFSSPDGLFWYAVTSTKISDIESLQQTLWRLVSRFCGRLWVRIPFESKWCSTMMEIRINLENDAEIRKEFGRCCLRSGWRWFVVARFFWTSSSWLGCVGGAWVSADGSDRGHQSVRRQTA